MANNKPPNKFNIGDNVKVYGYIEILNNITALEFREIDKIWCYQVAGGSWWAEQNLELIVK